MDTFSPRSALFTIKNVNFEALIDQWYVDLCGCKSTNKYKQSRCWFENIQNKIQKFHFVDISIWSERNYFFAFQKIGQLHFKMFDLYEIMSKMVVTLWIHFSIQLGYMLENFQIIWNCTTYMKIFVSRKKSRMIRNTKLLTIYLRNWKLSIPMVVVL